MNPYATLNEHQVAIVRAFRKADAKQPSDGMSLHALHLQMDSDLEALLVLRIVCKAGSDPETYYLSYSTDVFGPALPRRLILTLLCLAIVVVVAAFFRLMVGPPLPLRR